MKSLVILSLLTFSLGQFSPARAEEAPACQDSGKVYKICSDQEGLYSEQLAKAKKEKKTLLVVVGAEWCPWCLSLHKMLSDPAFGKKFSKKFVLADVGLYTGKVKVPSGVAVLEKLKLQANYTKKLEGIPVLAMVNPKNSKTVLIETEPLEKNTETSKGHDPEKLLAALTAAEKELK